MYKCEKGCPRKSGSDGEESSRINENGENVITYNCNICGHVTVFVEK